VTQTEPAYSLGRSPSRAHGLWPAAIQPLVALVCSLIVSTLWSSCSGQSVWNSHPEYLRDSSLSLDVLVCNISRHFCLLFINSCDTVAQQRLCDCSIIIIVTINRSAKFFINCKKERNQICSSHFSYVSTLPCEKCKHTESRYAVRYGKCNTAEI